MFKHLVGLFIVMWLVYLAALLIIVASTDLYYPIHSWLFADQWRWDSDERSLRFYKACIPASFIVAVVYTFKEYVDVKLKSKKNE